MSSVLHYAIHPYIGEYSRRSDLGEERLRRLSRLFRILSLVRSDKAVSLAQMAEECACSTKTIQRDINYWREIGADVEYDAARRRYVLRGGLPFEVLDLNVYEATALALAQALSANASGLNLARDLESSFDSIRALLREDIASRLDASREALCMSLDTKRDYSRAPVLRIIEAIRDRKCLCVDYDSRSSGRRKRTIEPYRLAYVNGFWILIARDPERNDVRSFALDRIHSADFVTPEKRFEMPRNWSMDEYLANSMAIMRGEATSIRLRFHGPLAAWAGEQRWRFQCTVTPISDGVTELSGVVSGLEEIARAVLSWGREVTVLEPEALRERVADEARAIADLYRK